MLIFSVSTPDLPMTATIGDTVAYCKTEAYHAWQFIGLWIRHLLHHPYQFVYDIVSSIHQFFINLPPFFTRVLFPAIVIYLIYYVISTILSEWQTFLDTGRGGTPTTPMGFYMVSMRKFFGGVNVLSFPHVHPMLEPYRGNLVIPCRKPPRPTIKGVAPQRQFDQKAPLSTFSRLLRLMEHKAEHDERLKVAVSFLERHTDALFGVFPTQTARQFDTDGEWNFEIAHPHRNDGSMHMVLHPEDVRTVIENNWGERHPLANDAWWWKFWHHTIWGVRRPVPYNLVIVYAPRTPKEFKTVEKILDAAIWYHIERDLTHQLNQGRIARDVYGKVIPRIAALRSGYWVEGPDGRLTDVYRARAMGVEAPSPTSGRPQYSRSAADDGHDHQHDKDDYVDWDGSDTEKAASDDDEGEGHGVE